MMRHMDQCQRPKDDPLYDQGVDAKPHGPVMWDAGGKCHQQGKCLATEKCPRQELAGRQHLQVLVAAGE